MRRVLTLLLLATLAVVLALIVGDNPASVTLFWYPWRIDASFNLVLALLVALFVLLYFLLRGSALLRALPEQARRWRGQQLERASHEAVTSALVHLMAGRFVRAQQAAREALDRLGQADVDAQPHGERLRAVAHLLLAESAHSIGDVTTRNQHLDTCLSLAPRAGGAEMREGALLRAVRWALEDGDGREAERRLGELPQGVARRIQSQRLRLRAARMVGDTRGALDVARLLVKYRAYQGETATSVVRSLVRDAQREARDLHQLTEVWRALPAEERRHPGTALEMVERWTQLAPGHDAEPESTATEDTASTRALREAMVAAWDGWTQWDEGRRVRLARVLEAQQKLLGEDWLNRVEQRQREQPGDPILQYLAGRAFLQRALWGKAALLLGQACRGLGDAELLRKAWVGVAQLAEERGDAEAALQAWKRAAQG